MDKISVSFPRHPKWRHASDSFLESYADGPDMVRHDWGPVQTFPARTEIFQQDTEASAVYMVEFGMVKLSRTATNGKEVIVGIRRRPWLIGAPAVLMGKPYSVTSVTLVRSSLRSISAEAFLHMVRLNDQFSWQLHQLLSQEIFNQMKRVEGMSCLPVRDRLGRFLYDVIQEQELAGAGKRASHEVPLKNHEIAQIIGVSPEHLCRLLKRMEQEGFISRMRGVLTVTDPSSLLQKTTQ